VPASVLVPAQPSSSSACPRDRQLEPPTSSLSPSRSSMSVPAPLLQHDHAMSGSSVSTGTTILLCRGVAVMSFGVPKKLLHVMKVSTGMSEHTYMLTKSPRPTEPPILSDSGNEYWLRR